MFLNGNFKNYIRGERVSSILSILIAKAPLETGYVITPPNSDRGAPTVEKDLML